MISLNREQYRASRADTGINLVLAGAGTGKTKTLVEKAANVMRDLPMGPEHILVLTFSRKAAGELRERVAACAGAEGHRIAAGTFHSFCLDLLQRHGGGFMRSRGFDRFPAVIDDEERKKIVMGLIYRNLSRFMGMPAVVVYDLLMKRGQRDPWKEKKLRESGLNDELELLSGRVREAKRAWGLIDYDDMMNFALELLSEDAQARAGALDRHRYIFVDEYQDVADDNFRLLKLLLPESGGNLFAVGDDWQSIYGFRGAGVKYAVRMKDYFPETRVHRLTINYRSRREIVSLSNRFIRRNRFRTRKRLRSHKGRGGRVRLFTAGSFEEEAEIVRGIISRRKRTGQVAVLYRNNWQGEFLKMRHGSSGDTDGVSFMTMHASKGLEFDAVVVAGVCDGIIPDDESGIEEERRLLYVACTRAREELHVIAHVNDQGEVARFGRELGIEKK